MSAIANTTRQHVHFTTQQSQWINYNGSSIEQVRDVITDGWRCKLTDKDYPASYLGSGDVLQTQRSTPCSNDWYDYEEIWLSYGAWHAPTVTT